MRIFQAFLVLVASTILFILPLTEAVDAFETDRQEDTFSVVTGIGETTDNITLSEELYESIADTKKELIPYLKKAAHFKNLSSIVISELEESKTFHSFNQALSKVWDYADRNLIWIEF